jgi:hypothetical protein
LETENSDIEIKDFFTVLSIRLLDAVQSFIQLEEWSGPAIWIGPFAFRQAHIESLIERAAKEGSRDVDDGDLKVLLG